MTNNKQFIGLILERMFISAVVAGVLLWLISLIPNGDSVFNSSMKFILGVSPFATICFIILESFMKTRSWKESLKMANEWLSSRGIIPSSPLTKEAFVIDFFQSTAFSIAYIFLLMRFNFNIIEACFIFAPFIFLSVRNSFLFFFRKKSEPKIT